MKNRTDSTVEEDISEITRKEIIKAWKRGENLTRIAQEVGLPIKVINRNLKLIEKTFIEKGVKSHEKKSYF
jgi:predicted transcriptional regulator